MALSWALAVLSFLPLLEAQNSTCADLTTPPVITNATLNVLSGKWFFIGSAFRKPEYHQAAQKIQAAFFYFVPNLTEDTILVREYQTMEDQCIYNSSQLNVQRENGTLSKFEWDKEHVAQLLLPKHGKTFMLAFFLEDEKNRGVSFYADSPETSPEQLEEFQAATTCIGMEKSEITYVDWKKDLCGPVEKQQELERKQAEQEA